MLKKEITYTDFNGQTVTEEFYFNLSKTELIELEAEVDGLESLVRSLTKSNDRDSIIKKFKEIVGRAYGVKSDDGKRFVKSPELSADFLCHAAFDELFMELITNEDTIITFVKGIMPKDLVDAVEKEQDQDKPKGLPRLAPAPPMPPTVNS